MSSHSEKTPSSQGSTNSVTPPKKSARLAEKRKLREEAGTPVSEDDYYFTPLLTAKGLITKNRSASPSSSRGTPSPQTTTTSTSPSSSTFKVENSKQISPPNTVQIATSNLLSTPTKSFSFLTKSTTSRIPMIYLDRNAGGLEDTAFKRLHHKESISIRPRMKVLPKKGNDLRNSEFGSGSNRSLESVSSFYEPTKLYTTRRFLALEKTETGEKPKPPSNAVKRGLQMRLKEIRRHDLDSRIIYLVRSSGNTITFPVGVDFPLKATTQSPVIPELIKCGIANCQNPKKYSCSKTKTPLCSLTCYKKNLEILEREKPPAPAVLS